MDVKISVYDGASNKHLEKLTLGLYSYSDRDKSRPVVRGNDSIPEKTKVETLLILLFFKLSTTSSYYIKD